MRATSRSALDLSADAPTEVLPHPPTEVAALVAPPVAEPPGQNQEHRPVRPRRSRYPGPGPG